MDDKGQIHVVISRESVEVAAIKTVQDVLGSTYNDSPLRQNLRSEASRQILGLDLRAAITAEISKQLPGLIETVVEKLLEAEIRRRGKAILGDALAKIGAQV